VVGRVSLQQAGVATIVDLPAVGTNFQDQPFNGHTFGLIPGPINLTVPAQPHATSPLGAAFTDIKQLLGDEAAQAFATSLFSTIPQRAAEVVKQGAFASVPGLVAAFTAQAIYIVNFSSPVTEFLGGGGASFTANGSATWGVNPITLLPASRGTVHIGSSDPLMLPVINPMALTSELDLQLHIQAQKMARFVPTVSPMREFSTAEISPGFSVVPENATDAEWTAWILENYMTAAHPIGTVPMLPRDLGGAVGPDLKVYGVQNVRVADASIIPVHISAHTSSTVYGIAERAADIIKGVISS